MVAAGDLRRGSKILYKGAPYTVLEYGHVKPGKGGAYARIKMKNLISGLVHEETWRAEEKLETPDLEYRDMVYLYAHDGLYEFMDSESSDMVAFDKNQVSDVLDFLKEQVPYAVLYFNGKPIAVNPPLTLDLEVTETVPGVKGDTAQGGGSKPATLDTGLVLQVPLFVNEGDIIRVDTREAKYLERIGKKK